MPSTTAEICDLARALCDEVVAPDFVIDHRWADGDVITDQEWWDLLALVRYEHIRRKTRRTPERRRAWRLLRRYLTPEQTRQLRSNDTFLVTGSQGGTYRMCPTTGHTDRVTRRGKRWWVDTSFCLHDFPRVVPAPDLTVAHLLWIRADEGSFLEMANHTARRCEGWWGSPWRAQLEAARGAREEQPDGGRGEVGEGAVQGSIREPGATQDWRHWLGGIPEGALHQVC